MTDETRASPSAARFADQSEALRQALVFLKPIYEAGSLSQWIECLLADEPAGAAPASNAAPQNYETKEAIAWAETRGDTRTAEVIRQLEQELAEARRGEKLARASQEDYHAANLALHKRIAELERVHADALEQWAKAEEALKASSATAPFNPSHRHAEGGLYEVTGTSLRVHVGPDLWVTGVRYVNEAGMEFVREVEDFQRRFTAIVGSGGSNG